MKMKACFCMALIGLVSFAIRHASAGSAVALAPHNQMVASYGHPVEVAKRRALDLARRKYGSNVRIFGATNIVGYGAIAKARHPNGYGWIITAALGKRSANEANSMAIEHCVRLGGIKPKVIWAFRG
jgi:hypothetical protein